MKGHDNMACAWQAEPISVENEIRVWETVKRVVKERLDGYPEGLEEDTESLKRDLEEKKMSENERNCLEFRLQ